MKKLTILISSCSMIGLLLIGCQKDIRSAQPQDPTEIETEIKTSGFDAKLAKELGADPYGMRQYVFATLLTGPNDAEITDETRRKALFAGHFSNMARLAEDGKLVLAGPFIEASPLRGLFILNVETLEEAEALVQSDPSIAAGIFKVEFAKYYGSAALMQVNEIHKTLQEKEM